MLPKFKSIIDLLKVFSSEQACIENLELHFWNNIPVSPSDKTSKFISQPKIDTSVKTLISILQLKPELSLRTLKFL